MLTVSLHKVLKKARNIGQKLAEKEPLDLKYIPANPFPYNCRQL